MFSLSFEVRQYKENKPKIEACEKDLTRSQHCILIAVPRDEQEEIK